MLALFVLCITGSYAQVPIGGGNNQDQSVPIQAYYGYTYSQSIYLASEINATGNITSLKWYFQGTTLLPNTQDLVIYLGHTDKTAFADNTDWVGAAELTQVYAGGITVSADPGWVTLTFDTPFAYNGTDNLVIAVDENRAGYDGSGDNFYNTAVTGNRSIYSYSDGVNTDPADPNTGSTSRGTVAFVPNVILGGIQQACPTPTDVVASGVTMTNANFTWVSVGTPTGWEVLIQEDGSEAPTEGTTGGTVVPGPTAAYTTTALSSASSYQFYVRAICGDTFSSWSSPVTVTTLCDPFDDFFEDFASSAPGGMPDCWSRIQPASADPKVDVYNTGSTANPNLVLRLYNSSAANATLIAVTPTLSALPAGTNRVRFTARGGTNYTLIVGTMSDRTNGATFTPVQTINLSNTNTEYYVTIPATTNGFVAFKHGLGGTYRTIYIDDVSWEALPAAAPQCISDLSGTINEECGNSATLFEWSAVDTAEGYYFSVGTTPGVYNVASNVSIGNVTNYSFVGEYNTTYYYTLVPFNGAGAATGCGELTFTTHEVGCYCTSVPQNVDNMGITNVQVGTTDFATPEGEDETLTYYSHADTPVDLARGLNSTVLISYETGYTYNTHIWIDFNDNYVFEDSERVYTGESTSDDVTVLDASFVMPANAPLGAHAMRLAGADSGQVTPNPCYGGFYGITLDFTANIVEPTCTPGVVASSVVVADCANNQYFVDVNITSLGDATSTAITYGETSVPVTATGVVHVGPFVSGTTNALTLVHSDALCTLPLGNFTYHCPPLNDNCSGATALAVSPGLACTAVTSGTLLAATDSGVAVPADSVDGTPNDDVWFSFVATAASHKITISNVSTSNFEFYSLVSEVFQGTCGTLTSIGEYDDNSYTLSDLTIGNTYYVRVYSYSDEEGADTTFDICVLTIPPPPANDDCSGAVALVTGVNFGANAVETTVGGATASTTTPNPTCASYSGGDIWYSAVIPADGGLVFETGASAGVNTFDSGMAVYSGTCDALTQIGCDDDGAATFNFSQITLANRTPGEVVYIRVWEFGGDEYEPFSISVWNANLGTSQFDNTAFSYYPNPVKNVLNLTYTQDISDVAVFNLLGQQVITKAVNSSNGQVDMSNLSAGTYIVKVTADNQVKTIKVIKE